MTKLDTTADGFRLSRIYAQGWNAALQRGGPPLAHQDKVANPYPSEPERTRWREGFAAARKGPKDV